MAYENKRGPWYWKINCNLLYDLEYVKLIKQVIEQVKIFKAKVKLESGNQKIQYGRQAAILKVTSLKINRLLPMATINMHMKFEIEIPKQTWPMLRKPCRLQTDGRTDGRTRWIQYTPPPPPPPPNFVGRWYNKAIKKPTLFFYGTLLNVSLKATQLNLQVTGKGESMLK